MWHHSVLVEVAALNHYGRHCLSVMGWQFIGGPLLWAGLVGCTSGWMTLAELHHAKGCNFNDTCVHSLLPGSLLSR